MAQPLEYRNAKAPQKPEPAPPPAPRVAIPVDFDSIVTRTKDLAAARAIQNQLARDNIEVFRTEEGEGADETVVLLVRANDQPHASNVAQIIFTRRRKLKSIRH